MPQISRTEIPNRNDCIGMKTTLDALQELPTDSPILRRAIRDIKGYVENSLINARSWSIDEDILKARITECNAFITTITNARNQGWEVGKKTIEDYYKAAKDRVIRGYIASDLKKILVNTYDALSGKFSMRHPRTDPSMRSIDDPIIAFHYEGLKDSMARIEARFNAPNNQVVDDEIHRATNIINTYLKTLTGEDRYKFKDRFGITSVDLELRLTRLQTLANIVERYLNAPAESQYNPAFICQISHEIMTDPVMIPESGHTFDRYTITSWFEGLKARGYSLTCPSTRQRVSGRLVPNIQLRQAIENGEGNNILGKDYFLMKLERCLSTTAIQEVKKGLLGSNLRDLFDNKIPAQRNLQPANQPEGQPMPEAANFNNGLPQQPPPQNPFQPE